MFDKYVFTQGVNSIKIGNNLFVLDIDSVEKAENGCGDNGKLSEEFFCVKTIENGIEREYNVWEDVPVIEMPMRKGDFTYPIEGNNYILRTVKLSAVTDYHDTFVSESIYYMFRRKIPKHIGNIFFLDEPLKRVTYIFISLSPDYVKASLAVEEGTVIIENDGHGIVFGKCALGDAEEICRKWYRKKCKPVDLYTMANTWGDCNAFNRVSDEFIKRELDAADKIGLDSLQIDDGWQTGNTADQSIRDERGRRVFKGDFWKLKEERFKNGMEEMRDYAKDRGVKLGLWFAPDSRNCYERFDRDIAVLEKAYREWGIRCFKLDMLYMDDMPMFKAFERMLKAIYSFGNDVSVQLDVTNGVRGGYLSLTQYGRLFAENRYSMLETYYPHRAMRNLWNICRFIPAYKFQFELINPTLKTEKYREDDLLAPERYDMDYLFATVMMSNPLFWMEVQFLPEKQREELNRIMPVWKEIKESLANADVVPVGQRPDGASFTGFAAYTSDGKKAYLITFREVTEDIEFAFDLKYEAKSAKLLASNSDIKYNISEGKLNVAFGKMRSYALIELEL